MRPRIMYVVASVAFLALLVGGLILVAFAVNRPAVPTSQAAASTPVPSATVPSPTAVPPVTEVIQSQASTITAAVQTQAPATEISTNSNRKITITSVGTVKAVPDIAYFNVGSEVQASTATEAMTKAATGSDAIYKALTQEGISENNIQTSGINVYPVSDTTAISKGPTSYRASFTYFVAISQLGNAGKILDSVAKAGANQISGLSYGIKDDIGYRAQAMEKALQLARPKAEAIARNLGTEITLVLTVEELQSNYYSPVAGYGLGGKSDAAGTSIAPGELTISVQVSISYGIR